MAASRATEFTVNLVASDHPVYSGRARYAVIPDPFGAMAFLPGHEPILCTLQKGVVRIDEPGGETLRFSIDRGFASFDSNKLTVAVGHAKRFEPRAKGAPADRGEKPGASSPAPEGGPVAGARQTH